MKRLFRILCVLLLSLVLPKIVAFANELDPNSSGASAGFYGEYRPYRPGTSEPLEPTPVPTSKPQNLNPEGNKVSSIKTPKEEQKPDNPETKVLKTPTSLPQTGDISNLPYVYGGLVMLVSCIMIPKGKMQYALKKHKKYKN